MIDTLKVAEDLQTSGFSSTQSRALVNAIASTRDELATKGDITNVNIRIDALQARVGVLTWMMGISIPLNIAILIALIFR